MTNFASVTIVQKIGGPATLGGFGRVALGSNKGSAMVKLVSWAPYLTIACHQDGDLTGDYWEGSPASS